MLQLQREYLSNFINGKPNKKTPSALAFIDATLKSKDDGILSVPDEKILKELKAKFLDGDQLSLEKLEKSLSQNEKKALALYDEVNNSLAEKALFVSTMHGSKIDLINNYTHHVAILAGRANETSNNNIINNFVNTVNGSTKTKTIIETVQAPGILVSPGDITISNDGKTAYVIDTKKNRIVNQSYYYFQF